MATTQKRDLRSNKNDSNATSKDSEENVDIKSTINCSVQSAMKPFIEQISNLIQETNKKFDIGIETLEKRFTALENNLQSTITSYGERLAETGEKVTTLENTCSALQTQINDMNEDYDARLASTEERLAALTETTKYLSKAYDRATDSLRIANEVDQSTRRKNLRIRVFGALPTLTESSSGESGPLSISISYEQHLIQQLQDRLELQLTTRIESVEEIVSKKRGGNRTADQNSNRPHRSDGGDHRLFLIRFTSQAIRDAALRNRRKLKGTIFTVFEDLTHINVQLMSRLRNQPCVESVWSWNGHIRALTKSGKRLLFDVTTPIEEKLRNETE